MPKTHKVVQGDCISSIAASHGFLPETLWDAPENDGLHEGRPHLNALAPGDQVVIPDPTDKEFEKGLDARHKFVRKGVPEKIKLVMKDEDGKPRAELDWKVELPGHAQPIEGTTGDDGLIEFTLDPKVRRGMLKVGAPDFEEEHVLQFGGVDPISTLRGQQHRLENLGYECKPSGKLDAQTKAAILSFQSDAELELTGECDDATQSALEERYGC